MLSLFVVTVVVYTTTTVYYTSIVENTQWFSQLLIPAKLTDFMATASSTRLYETQKS